VHGKINIFQDEKPCVPEYANTVDYLANSGNRLALSITQIALAIQNE